MVLQNYQNFIEMTSNMIYIVALGGGLKCPRKVHLNTQWGGGRTLSIVSHFQWPSSLKLREASLAAYMIVLTCEGSSQVEAAAATATAPVHIVSFLNFYNIPYICHSE